MALHSRHTSSVRLHSTLSFFLLAALAVSAYASSPENDDFYECDEDTTEEFSLINEVVSQFAKEKTDTSKSAQDTKSDTDTFHVINTDEVTPPEADPLTFYLECIDTHDALCPVHIAAQRLISREEGMPEHPTGTVLPHDPGHDCGKLEALLEKYRLASYTQKSEWEITAIRIFLRFISELFSAFGTSFLDKSYTIARGVAPDEISPAEPFNADYSTVDGLKKLASHVSSRMRVQAHKHFVDRNRHFALRVIRIYFSAMINKMVQHRTATKFQEYLELIIPAACGSLLGSSSGLLSYEGFKPHAALYDAGKTSLARLISCGFLVDETSKLYRPTSLIALMALLYNGECSSELWKKTEGQQAPQPSAPSKTNDVPTAESTKISSSDYSEEPPAENLFATTSRGLKKRADHVKNLVKTDHLPQVVVDGAFDWFVTEAIGSLILKYGIPKWMKLTNVQPAEICTCPHHQKSATRARHADRQGF